MAQKLYEAARGLLAVWDTRPMKDPKYAPIADQALKDAIERLRQEADRTCATCMHFRPPRFDYGRNISGWCGKEPHSPPRDPADTCRRFRKRSTA